MATSTLLNPDGTPQLSLMQQAAAQMARDNTVTPTLTNFDESKGVAGRVADITSQGSPLMQQAATSGKEYAAGRGLLNSSLGAQASQQAVLSAATPIATADAGLYQQAQLSNQAASNQASLANSNIGLERDKMDTQKSQFAQQLGVTVQDLDLRRDQLSSSDRQFLDTLNQRKAELAQQQSQFETTNQVNQGQFQSELAQRQAQFQATQAQALVVQKLDQDNKIALANIEAQFKNSIQSNTNISQAWGTTMTGITQIQNNPQIEEGAKRTLIQNQLDSFGAFAQFWQKQQPTLADIGPLLDFGAPGVGATPGAGAVAAPTIGQSQPAAPIYAPQPVYGGSPFLGNSSEGGA